MMSIGEIQKSGQGREDEQKEARKEAEAKLAECETSLATANQAIATLNAEKIALSASLEQAREQLVEATATISEIKAELAAFRSDSSGLESELKLEKELRSRAEEKEKEEKNERIAVSAQMMAMTTDHATKELRIREEGEQKERETEAKITELKTKLEVRSGKERSGELRGRANGNLTAPSNAINILLCDSLRSSQEANARVDERGEQIRGLESERNAFKEAMQSQEFQHSAQSTEEIARLKGEVEVLREKVRKARRCCMLVPQLRRRF